ncbi:MAG: lyase family protein, partial [Vulcanimicrobiaceae bacterium]
MSAQNGTNGPAAALQWGGRFAQAPDPVLMAFGSSLEDDLVLAPFDVLCSQAHVEALRGGKVIDEAKAASLHRALARVANEVHDGAFAAAARAGGFEDVHGAIDARVRDLCDDGAGDWLHAGRSRNDQVATTLALYARHRARDGARASSALA